MKPIKPALLIAIGLVVGAIVAVVLVLSPLMPAEMSEQAENTDLLFEYMLVIAGVIFGLVTVILAYVIYAFRARNGDQSDGAPIHGVTWLEIVWTAIPAVIVVSIAVFSWSVLDENEAALALPKDQVNEVHITGFQFDWEYDYLDYGLEDESELVLPVGEPVVFTLDTRDVIHSFWVPDWRLQMNTTPGQVNTLTVTPTKTGSIEVVCAFLCGGAHSAMNSGVEGASVKPIRVVTREEYDQWISERQAKKAEADAAATAAATTEAAA